MPTHLLTLQEMYARAQDDSWGYRTKYLPRLNQGQAATGDALAYGKVSIPTPERESFEAETRWWTDAYVEHILQPDYHRNAQAHRRPYKHILDLGGDTLGGIEREVRWLLGPLPRPVGARLSPGVQFAKTVVAGMLTLLGLDFFVDGFEASTGEDFITGAPLTPGQKAFSGLASTTPFVAALWLRRAENAADFNPLARHADDLPTRHLDPIPAGGSYGVGGSVSQMVVPAGPYQTRYYPRFPGRPDPRYSVDTSTFTGGEITSGGGIRNAQEFWQQWQQLRPESLSASNQHLIENFQRLRVSPRIDDTWIRAFPEHARFRGDVIIHHHVDLGRYAIPVLGQTHVGSGGPWHAK